MTELYTTTDEVRVAEIAARYDIRFIVFGVAEQRLVAERAAEEAEAAGSDEIPDLPVVATDGATILAAACVQVVFREGTTFVVQVDTNCVRATPPRG